MYDDWAKACMSSRENRSMIMASIKMLNFDVNLAKYEDYC